MKINYQPEIQPNEIGFEQISNEIGLNRFHQSIRCWFSDWLNKMLCVLRLFTCIGLKWATIERMNWFIWLIPISFTLAIGHCWLINSFYVRCLWFCLNADFFFLNLCGDYVFSILYNRGVYPEESFKKVKKYGLTMLLTEDEGVKTFVSNLTAQLAGKL